MQATLKQLRRETGTVMRTVARGDRVIVTYRGRPVAEVSAVRRRAGTEKDELFGIWKNNPAVARVEDYVAKVRKGRLG